MVGNCRYSHAQQGFDNSQLSEQTPAVHTHTQEHVSEKAQDSTESQVTEKALLRCP